MSILICYDGSPSSKQALGVAHRALNGAGATLLYVFNPPDRVIADAFSLKEGPDGPSQGQLQALVRDRALEVLGEGQELAQRLGVSVTTRPEANHSSVWRTILDVAEELDADLIVTGTHGSTAVEPGLLGSVSGALAHHSHRPVLVVPNEIPA
ncbi:MAG TPA: universal stress protein [Solirubrobacteraceae bacterium]|jgi:nucleotide-binding universal stress UspA family protein